MSSTGSPVGDGAGATTLTPIYTAAQPPPAYTPRSIQYTVSTVITVIDAEPSYRPSLPDGTLLTSTYVAAARDMAVFLFVGGIVLAVFLRNIVIAAKYLRTVAARDKSLFHLLFFAQLWGPIAVLAMLLPIAVDSVNCTATNLVAALSIQISFATLLSGILGIKAYRCLNKSRSVLLAICITQVSALALSAVELPKFKSTRSIAGVCTVPAELRLIPTAFILNTIETLVFVGMCFGYAIWNASKRSANLGRLSLDLSNEPAPTRGWWDYAPTIVGAPTVTGAPSIMRSNSVSTTGRADMEAGGTNLTSRSAAISRAADQLTLGSLARKGVRGVTAGGGWEKIDDEERAAAGSPSGQRRGSQQSDDEGPKFTRIVLLNDAVKNELFYTGLILAFHTPAMVMFPVSARYKHLWPPVFWLGISWCITSVLVIRSFAPVVKRHEREAILREPLQPGWAPDPLDAPSGPPRPKQTPWGRAVSFSTNSMLSYPNVRRRGSTATSAAQSIAFSSAAHSNAFQSKEWISTKRSKLDLVSSEPRTAGSSNSLTAVGSSSRPAGSISTAGVGSSKLRTGTTATALIPLNSSTVWAGSGTPNNPFADPARTPNGQVSNLVDVTVLPNSPNATGPAPELWRRGSVSGLSITSASGLQQQQPGPSRPRHNIIHARRGSQDVPPPTTSSRRGSAAGLGIAGVPLVPIGEAATPLTPTFDLVELERRPSPRSHFHLVEPGEGDNDLLGQDPMSVPLQVVGYSAEPMTASQLLDLEAQPRTQIRDASPRPAKERRVRDGSRTIAFDLDVGVLGRGESESYGSNAERRQFGSADALLSDRERR